MSIYGNPVMLGGSGGGGGASILSGTSDPASGQGNNGQIYLMYGSIPSGYTPLEYLAVETMGPYIDTGKLCNSKAYYSVDAQYTDTPGNNYGIFGAYGGSSEFIINSYGGVSYASANSGSGANRAVFTDTATQRHLIEAKSDGIYIDGTITSAVVNWSIAPALNYYVFAFNYGGGNLYKTANTKIYAVKLYDDDALTNWLVACKRNSDNELGMYDMVQRVFRTNAGTGSFVAGPESQAPQSSKIVEAYAKVSGAWQDLIGTDIDDINLGGGGGGGGFTPENVLSGTMTVNTNGVNWSERSIAGNRGTLKGTEYSAGFEGFNVELQNLTSGKQYILVFSWETKSGDYFTGEWMYGYKFSNGAVSSYDVRYGESSWTPMVRDLSKHTYSLLFTPASNTGYLVFAIPGYSDEVNNVFEVTDLMVIDPAKL